MPQKSAAISFPAWDFGLDLQLYALQWMTLTSKVVLHIHKICMLRLSDPAKLIEI